MDMCQEILALVNHVETCEDTFMYSMSYIKVSSDDSNSNHMYSRRTFYVLPGLKYITKNKLGITRKTLNLPL